MKLKGVKTEVVLDNGSDRFILTKPWLQNYSAVLGNPSITIVPNSHRINLADPQYSIETISFVKISISFFAYDGLNLRDLVFFVVEQDVGQPIIGLSELEELGLDPKSTSNRLSHERTVSDNY